MEVIIALATGLSLATASGLNAYLPLLSIGIFARMGWIELAQPFDLLSNVFVLAILVVLTIADLIGDKVPAVDSGLHAVGLVISPIAGAILAIASQGDLATVNPVLLGVAGLVAAGSTHSIRAAIRPVITAATGGTGNAVVSAVEDGASLMLTVMAIIAPIIALLIALVGGFFAWRVFQRARRVWQKA